MQSSRAFGDSPKLLQLPSSLALPFQEYLVRRKGLQLRSGKDIESYARSQLCTRKHKSGDLACDFQLSVALGYGSRVALAHRTAQIQSRG
jgi:hypothetical protein